MASFQDLNIAAKANTGIVIPVTIPGKQEIKTEDTLTVLSTYSERFRKAEAEGYRRLRDHVKNNPDQEIIDETLYEIIALDSVASLVSEWSYDEPCCNENVKLFLSANPHMYDVVNRTAADHALFFAAAATSLSQD